MVRFSKLSSHYQAGIFLLWILFFAEASFAEDWPQFRGPTGQGISQSHHLPVEWSETKNVAWKTAIPGLGWSSPVIVNGHISPPTAGAGNGQNSYSLRALALDPASGSIQWNVEVFAPQGSPSV